MAVALRTTAGTGGKPIAVATVQVKTAKIAKGTTTTLDFTLKPAP